MLVKSPKATQCVILCGGADAPDLKRVAQLISIYSSTFLVGVDRGGLALIKAGYSLDYAFGDFDSVTPDELEIIREHSHKLQQYSPIKDDTDMELALSISIERYSEADYYVFGGIGEQQGRLDHMFANIWLVYQPRFQAVIHRLQFIESNHVIKFYKPGSYQIQANKQTDYLSLISMTALKQLSIQYAKYELDPVDIAYPRALISNEFIDQQPVQISFEEGIIMVMWVEEE
ncbi:thiamine diphosphokinase [Fundicoccus sp. Sow4_F4]|uniref:thiamine diphosphokinase n=1 Tax=Fundicoccus sp. Sow4_F4 TaxID=3438783 RepID=UPI003F9164D1